MLVNRVVGLNIWAQLVLFFGLMMSQGSFAEIQSHVVLTCNSGRFQVVQMQNYELLYQVKVWESANPQTCGSRWGCDGGRWVSSHLEKVKFFQNDEEGTYHFVGKRSRIDEDRGDEWTLSYVKLVEVPGMNRSTFESVSRKVQCEFFGVQK